MAEFCEVIFKYKEMCKGADCDKCPLSQTRNGYSIKCDDLLTEMPGAFERIVMTHTEPKLPTWNEWQHENFPDAGEEIDPCCFMSVGDAGCHKILCDECRNQPIPPDIAEKLGIKPKEEK